MTRPCLPQGKAVTLRGTLALVDENGYRQWIALRPGRPFCTLADATDKFSAGADQIHEVQAVSADRENARSRLERLLGRKVAVTGTLTQWHTGSQRAAVVSGNFATTLKLADKEPHRVAGQSDQDHHHGPAEARRFGATLGTLHLKHLRGCSSTFRSRWEGPLRGRSRRIQCQHPLDPAREEGVLRQNVDETGIHFTVRQYSSRSMMVSTRVVCAGSLGSSLPNWRARISAGAHLGFSQPARAASFR